MHNLTLTELAALERLRANAPRTVADEMLAINALLRLIPADDGEAIDAEFLKSIGFFEDYGEFRLEHTINDRDVATIIFRHEKWSVGGGSKNHQTLVSIRPPKTRGQLRALCSVLGIPLKENDK